MHCRATCSNVAPVSAAMRAPQRARLALFKRIDLLVLQLAPQLERLLARLRQRDELDAAKAHPALALLVLVAQDPWRRQILTCRYSPRPSPWRPGLACFTCAVELAHLAPGYIPGFVRGFQRNI